MLPNLLSDDVADMHFVSLQDFWRLPRLPPPHAHHSVRWIRRRADGHHRERVQLTQLSTPPAVLFICPHLMGCRRSYMKKRKKTTKTLHRQGNQGFCYRRRTILGGTFITAQLRMPFFTSTLEQRGIECSVSRWQRWECLCKGSFLVTVPASLRPCREGMCGGTGSSQTQFEFYNILPSSGQTAVWHH